MKLTVPETLKALLVDDWECVTKNNQVRLFPCTYPGAMKFDMVRISWCSLASNLAPFAECYSAPGRV